jgi:hypothetical protein
MLIYFAISAIFSLLSSFGLIVAYAITVFNILPASEIWLTILRKLLIDLAVMSLPLMWVFMFKGAVFPAVITLIESLAVWFSARAYGAPKVPKSAEALMTTALFPLRAENLPSWSLLKLPVYVPLAVIALVVGVSWLLFLKTDLD